jgi:hypothetical protein
LVLLGAAGSESEKAAEGLARVKAEQSAMRLVVAGAEQPSHLPPGRPRLYRCCSPRAWHSCLRQDLDDLPGAAMARLPATRSWRPPHQRVGFGGQSPARGVPAQDQAARRFGPRPLQHLLFICSASGNGTTPSSREATGEPSVAGSRAFFCKMIGFLQNDRLSDGLRTGY